MPEHGIHTIDTGYVRPCFDAAYLVVENGRGAFVDCGTNHSVDRLLAALAPAGLAPADIDWLVLTHVHLDHAGGAGTLMRQLPNARLVAHPRAAPHMIDPARLIAGAMAVLGTAGVAPARFTVATGHDALPHGGRRCWGLRLIRGRTLSASRCGPSFTHA